MRRYLLGGNWKLNGTVSGARLFMDEIGQLLPDAGGPEIVVFPPFTLIPCIREDAAKAGVLLGGQDLFWEEKGAFTGEVSAGMLEEAGCSWFLAGHSERRHILGEDDDTVRRKLHAGLSQGLHGILCVGELEGERREGRTEEVVRRQVESGLRDFPAPVDHLAIAYEPVWAIGTGLTASPEEAQRVHSLVREWVGGIAGMEFSESLRIIYGGSVKPGNAAAILEQPDVDGALVGGASLSPGGFAEIAAAAGSSG